MATRIFEPYCSKKEEFTNYIIRLENYFNAYDIQEEKKAPVFISLMGSENFEILKNSAFPKCCNKLKFEEIVEIFRIHYDGRKNKIYERFKFHKMAQGQNESINEYVLRLKAQAAKCEYNTNLEENLMDRFVATLNDNNIVRRLLTEINLTFNKACEIAKTMEKANLESCIFKHKESEILNTHVYKKYDKVYKKC